MTYSAISFFRNIFFIFFAIIFSGCTHLANKADTNHECGYFAATYRNSNIKFDPETENRPSGRPALKILDLTDNGELVDRCQWSDVLYEVQGNYKKNPLIDRPKFVVFYIHGWKHNASKDDTDLAHFSDFIKRLNDLPNFKDKSDVIGIYISWPGSSTTVPMVDNLTFWSRKSAADRASAVANVSKLISSVASIKSQRKNNQDFILSIGHSFGARILFSAVSPLLLHEMQVRHPGIRGGSYGKIDGVVDLTLLLNPAFEASRYSAFDATRRWQEKFNFSQQPLLLTISTSNDFATKLAFPVGQTIGFRIDERERTTLGNYDEYISHRLVLRDREDHNISACTWYDDFCTNNLCLSRMNHVAQPGNPFLVARTDGAILDGHNGIWVPSFQDWLVSFVTQAVEKRRVAAKDISGKCDQN
ncbi:hypothetical protein [Duganella sp. BuS-21]|uniref:hypothetical protein n=1 Tax=Duganella sp. BuS-21 TaxID=2943848 RepID=UPI0035A62AEC